MKKHMLDLYAGLGGMSESFIRSPSWSVLRIDNNPMLSGVENMVLMDVEHVDPHPSWTGHRIEYIHASPPCDEFSLAYNSKRANHLRESDLPYLPNMKPLFEAIRIIEQCNPRFWTIENVAGSVKFYEPFLGKPTFRTSGHVFWGNHPSITVDKTKIKSKQQKDKRHSPMRANHRGKIDFEISRQMMKAIENQKSLFNY